MTETTLPAIISDLHAKFPLAITDTLDTYGMVALSINSDALIEISNYLVSQGFTFLVDLCGVHYPDHAEPKIGVVYQFMNMVQNVRIRLKVLVPDTPTATIPSLTGIFAASNWMERETYDFYGIQFSGHPDLRRILNEDEMTYFPMRKEYPLEDDTRTDKSDVMFGR